MGKAKKNRSGRPRHNPVGLNVDAHDVEENLNGSTSPGSKCENLVQTVTEQVNIRLSVFVTIS